MIYLLVGGLRLGVEETAEAVDRPPAGVTLIEDPADSPPASLIMLWADGPDGAGGASAFVPGLVLARASYSSPPELAVHDAADGEPLLCVGLNRFVVLASARTLSVRAVLDLPSPFVQFLDGGENDPLLVLHEIGVGRVDVAEAAWRWQVSLDIVTQTATDGGTLVLDTMGGRYTVELDTGETHGLTVQDG